MDASDERRLMARRLFWSAVWHVELGARIGWAAGRWTLGVLVLGGLLAAALYVLVSAVYFVHLTVSLL